MEYISIGNKKLEIIQGNILIEVYKTGSFKNFRNFIGGLRGKTINVTVIESKNRSCIFELSKQRFYVCVSLSRVRLSNIKNINEKAFYHCVRLREVLNAEWVKQIKDFRIVICLKE